MKQLIQQYADYLKLHAVVFVWGFTGILGKHLTIDSSTIVWYRMFIAAFTLFLYLKWRKTPFTLPAKNGLPFLIIGGIVAAHWITFFEALHVSTVSVTLVCLSSASLWVAFLEPLFFKRKINWWEVFFGLVVIAGLYTIFNFESDYKLGIIIGIASAFFAALFTSLNGLFVNKVNTRVMTLYEMAGGFIVVTIYQLFTQKINLEVFQLSSIELSELLILGIICTAVAFIVSLDVMRNLSPFTVSMTINLEPVYSIILAILLFPETETMSFEFYIGALIILVAVFGNAYNKALAKRKAAKLKAQQLEKIA